MPYSSRIVRGFFNVPQELMNMEDICETGPTVYSPHPRRLGKSNHLQMKLKRQHFLLRYFKILSVDLVGVRTRGLPHDSPLLNQGISYIHT